MIDSTWVQQLFVGRRTELDQLRALFSEPSGRSALILGDWGQGKTSLLQMFAMTSVDGFPGSVHEFEASNISSVEDFEQPSLSDAQTHLIILDDCDQMTKAGIAALARFVLKHPDIHILMAARHRPLLGFSPSLELELKGFTREETFELISLRAAAVSPDLALRFGELVNGNPLLINSAARTVRDQLLTWSQVLSSLVSQDFPGIVLPDGRSIGRQEEIPHGISIAVADVNYQLLEQLSKNPTEFWMLSPRRFEELIADLLSKLGYTVQLTPFSGDGGFDMYAAKKDHVGSFLYLVECKRYVPPDKVGVQVIRSLHGVVQMKRANAGLVVTSSFFTKGARELKSQLEHQMHFADYLELQRWLHARK